MNSQPRVDIAAPFTVPDLKGRYGPFGGRYVPETLVPALDRLQAGVDRYLNSADFQAEFTHELKTWVGRPTALSFAPALSKRWGAEIWLKREDLAHTGAHKINNAVGQTLLAKRLGAKRIIAENRRGTTWCRQRRGGRQAWDALCGLYGCGRRRAPGAQRGAHAAHGCDGGAGHRWRQNLARRHR